MDIEFKGNEYLNSRAVEILNEDKGNDNCILQNPDEIKENQLLDDFISDLKKHLNNEEPKNDILIDLEQINKSIDLKPSFLHKLLFINNFPQIILDLLIKFFYINEESKQYFKIISSILYCIAKLLAFKDFRDFFIDNEIISHAMNLISHESSKIARESIHIISKLIFHVIQTDYPIPEYFIYHISINVNICRKKPTKYAVKIFSIFAQYYPNKEILIDAIPTILELYKQAAEEAFQPIIDSREEERKKKAKKQKFNSEIDGMYYKLNLYDPILKYIVQTIYYILESDFSFYFHYQDFFDFLFYNVNGFSTTLTDKVLVSFTFKILLLIIYNNEDEATRMVSLIGNLDHEKKIEKIKFDYSIYLYFLQNSDFVVNEPLTQIIIFNLFHLPPSFYEFVSSSLFIELSYWSLIRYDPFHLKPISLKFFRYIIQHPNSKEIIQYLIDEDFINETSSFLDGDDFDAILDYLLIINKMIEYANISASSIKSPEKNPNHKYIQFNPATIIGRISNSPQIYENIDRLIDELPQELKDLEENPNQDESIKSELKQKQSILELCQAIKAFCCQKDEEGESTPSW